MNPIALIKVDGKVWITSLQIADLFDKEHRNVLQSIRDVECSANFRLLNFQPSVYVNEQGKEQPLFRITESGCMRLVMAFTGEKAAAAKEQIIEAFQSMRAELRAIADDGPRWQKQIIERQTAVVESLRNTTMFLSCGVNEVKERTKEHGAKIEEHEARIVSLETKKQSARKEINQQTRAAHLFVWRQDGCRCPYCHDIVDRIELDHAYACSLADFAHTWPVCIECHKGLTTGRITRSEAEKAFHAYQDYAERVIPRQSALFDKK